MQLAARSMMCPAALDLEAVARIWPSLIAAVLFSMARRALLSFFLAARSSYVNGRLRGVGLAGSRATHSLMDPPRGANENSSSFSYSFSSDL